LRLSSGSGDGQGQGDGGETGNVFVEKGRAFRSPKRDCRIAPADVSLRKCSSS
jgi:hypothetical protein